MNRLTDWIRDTLGINKYAVVWDFKHCGVRVRGRNDFRTLGWATKRQAQGMADQLSRSYGLPGSHWIESVGAELRSLSEGGTE